MPSHWGPARSISVFKNVNPPIIYTVSCVYVCNYAFTFVGASRVLQALAKDRLFGESPVKYLLQINCTFLSVEGILCVFTKTVGKKKEPLFAVIFSWLFVQVRALFNVCIICIVYCEM